MTADQVAKVAETSAHYLDLLGDLTGVSEFSTDATLLRGLANDTAECQVLADLVNGGAKVLQVVADWLKSKLAPKSAAALLAIK